LRQTGTPRAELAATDQRELERDREAQSRVHSRKSGRFHFLVRQAPSMSCE
jgi:hypothetical protein